jgi:muconate cycloisomerase
MKITKIDVWTVVVPVFPEAVHSEEYGGYPDWARVPKQMIQIHTNEGLTGIGETGRGQSTAAVRQSADGLIGRDLTKVCLQNVFRTESLKPTLESPKDWEMNPGPYPAGYEAFEMAIFDLLGKRMGVPVHTLLGGACRDWVRADFWIGHQTPEHTGRSTKIAIERGFTGLKTKCRIQEPMVERVRAMWEVGGSDFKVTIDPNERFYTVEQTLELAEQLKELENVEVFEDPIPKKGLRDDVLAQYRYMRGKLPFPLALHLGGAEGVLKAIKADCVDYLNLGGSMVNFVKAAAIANAAGIPVWHGSGNDLGIMEMSYLHAASVAPNCVLASDFVGSWTRVNDLILEGLTFKNGFTPVPQTPGLGCELDLDAVEKYRVE